MAGVHPDSPRFRNMIAWLALASIDGVGYWTLKKLSSSVESWADLVEQSSVGDILSMLRNAGGKPHPKSGRYGWELGSTHFWDRGLMLYKKLTDRDIVLLLKDDPLFPPQLHEAPDPPAWIFVQGNPMLLARASVTIVGTRDPSPDGLFLATYLGHCLWMFGGPTVSGLALGIDQAIHELSIRYGVPTIAVLGTGILRDFPAGSEALRAKILKTGGAVISEYLPDQTYSAENFVRRNRIQAALGRVTIPVEWRIKSGTAHTVENARKMGRPIVCLRLPDWSAELHPELSLLASNGAELICIPGEEDRLIKTVQGHIAARRRHDQISATDQQVQMDLLSDDTDDEA